MDFGIVLLLGFFGWLAWLMLRSKKSEEKMHCMACGVDSNPTIQAKGSTGVELVLWLCFIVPGLIYSIWRLSSKRMVCPSCGASGLIPADSPAAVKHRKDLS